MGQPVGIVIIMVGGSHGGNMQQPGKIDEADVLEKLKAVQDPHLRRDIVSLGFVPPPATWRCWVDAGELTMRRSGNG